MATYLRALVAGVAVLGFALLAAACGSDSKTADNSSSTSQASIHELTQRVQRNEMINAWVTISALPIHELDDTMQQGTIDPDYIPTLRTLIRVLVLTEWSSDIQPEMTAYHDDAVKLYQALNAGKTAADVKAMSGALHLRQHEFPTTVGNVIAGTLPADAGGPEGTHSDDAQTPADGMATPAHGESATPMHDDNPTPGHTPGAH